MYKSDPPRKDNSYKAAYTNSFLFCLLFFTFIFPAKGIAQGDLLIMPKRIVFQNSKKPLEINLANMGNDTAKYVVSFIHLGMTEDGLMEKLAETDTQQNFADKYVRFFPRSVTLAPRESQTIRIQLFNADQLTDGEYRSHLYFRAVPHEAPLDAPGSVNDSSISVQLIPVFGISVPLIIRKGISTATVRFAESSFYMVEDTMPVLKMIFQRSGNMSVYGDISVDHISPGGKSTHVGIVKGLAVYTPNDSRRLSLLLDTTKGVNYHAGKLHLVYAADINKPDKLAETEVPLN